ncbi:hypothetical protein CEXT_336141 [Caerostris extrusa]|uniref:Uncharacterized protein n=1 Tax=Caerostris extrusa TaxID=172846 RepID=A0AAV4S8Y7_CAEEX|nr:hypothetical protein CEXT_336141 [Caerostris extrusa]
MGLLLSSIQGSPFTRHVIWIESIRIVEVTGTSLSDFCRVCVVNRSKRFSSLCIGANITSSCERDYTTGLKEAVEIIMIHPFMNIGGSLKELKSTSESNGSLHCTEDTNVVGRLREFNPKTNFRSVLFGRLNSVGTGEKDKVRKERW